MNKYETKIEKKDLKEGNIYRWFRKGEERKSHFTFFRVDKLLKNKKECHISVGYDIDKLEPTGVDVYISGIMNGSKFITLEVDKKDILVLEKFNTTKRLDKIIYD